MRKASKTLIVAVLFICQFSFAGNNNDKYDKLKELYEAGKYEDCAFKAENYTMKDDMKKDPEPYLYISMSYYQLSMLSSKELDYPKAYENAFKFASKTAKYDKTGEVMKTQKDFFNELQESGIKDAKGYFNSGNYSKAAKCLERILSFNPDDQHVRITKGICDILSKNEGEGGMELKTGFTQINTSTKPNSENTEKLLTDAFLKYSEYLNSSQRKDSAKATIDIAKVILPDSMKLQSLN